MTPPHGRYDRTLTAENYIEFYEGRVLFDDACCLIGRADWERLANYVGTIPTGKSVGKVWRIAQHGNPEFDGTFCMYDELDPPEEHALAINTWPVIVVD